MKIYQFEQYIKSSLSTSSAPLDTASFMHGLFEEMDRTPKRKRMIPFWWTGTAMLILTLLVGYYISVGSSNAGAETNPKSPKAQSAPMAATESEYAKETIIESTAAEVSNAEAPISIATTTKVKDINSGATQKSGSKTQKLNNITSLENKQQSIYTSNQVTFEDLSTPSELGSSIQLLERRQARYDFNNQVKCPTFGRTKHFSFYLIPEIGYFSSNKSLEYVGNEPTDVFALRNANESTKEGLAAALYLQANHNSLPFYLKAGISYGRITERMDLSYRYTVQDTTQGIISITVSQTGDTITTIVGDIITERTISGQRRQHHYHHMIDIPVAVGFEQSYDRWFYGAELGISLNVSLFQSGQILANANEFAPIDDTGQFKNNIGIGLFGGVHIGYKITDHLSAFLAARYRHLPGNFTVQQSDIQQSYSLMGLHAGVRIPLQW